MRKSLTLASLAVASLAVAPMLGVGAAFAAEGDTTANLEPVALNGVDASGTAMVQVNGTTVDVTMAASGLLPDNPHAAHIHFGADARHECPAASDDANGDGTINTTDGEPAYGPIVVSLTKTGDTSPDSALAVDRFDTAPGGELSYERGSIEVSEEVATAVTNDEAVIVVHGVDYNGSGTYDGETMSELDPALPTEATDPAICGVLSAAPAGGADTGNGGAATATDFGLLALGGGVTLMAAGIGVATARRARVSAR
ncbi:CHRD domain-containing protein [Jiangella asiatica]|uniref:CHRD domain-containing protein n=1 Tax=Jiangella asiatica TaxID=2530372 RepID=A0A4R5DIC8_9ACTN|nr:CHRD domain-containing protein [Jiangella asiatica]TDE13057.1 CHRD domain-containing protein [Jiangella asiatica]